MWCNSNGLKRLSSAVLLSMTMLLNTSVEASDNYFVYVGTYTEKSSKGIYAYRLNVVTGETAPIGLVANSENLSFLAVHPNGRFVYAVNELDHFGGQTSGAVSAFAVDAASGKLKLLNQVPSMGAGPAH